MFGSRPAFESKAGFELDKDLIALGAILLFVLISFFAKWNSVIIPDATKNKNMIHNTQVMLNNIFIIISNAVSNRSEIVGFVLGLFFLPTGPTFVITTPF
jgi:hypothetical protein